MWKKIIVDNIETNYAVSENGEIKNLKTDKILKLNEKRTGYMEVCIYPTPKNKKTLLVHRLVAENFLEKEEGKTQVNHKDGNKKNNNVNNLEWCSSEENNLHAWENSLNRPNVLRAVIQKDLNNRKIKEFVSIAEAERETFCNGAHIRQVANGERKTCGGYIWEWKENFIPKDIGRKKKVAMLDKDNETIIEIFESVSEAGRKTGSNRKGISAVCLGKQKTCNNYKWKFI